VVKHLPKALAPGWVTTWVLATNPRSAHIHVLLKKPTVPPQSITKTVTLPYKL